ncbi:MAG: branched-chain amino acid ABC transporter permease [Ornithinimicrobium sp.]|uniref:branched-chain amino acid ABC transporter permease n=1 Tax=Ornithinimicrobium sp. TaxID=1977084 RepID=UPI0026E00002|nr:branched-chain amino acid ABC transporter permease [Ornithinimicrobium sp.]MDO5740065.1 branched-chain amino acid ABC transporter permease [Ornithinimicrobium sp.]
MDLFAQQLVDGLTLGSVYALIALGYTLIYGVLQLLNFAHGDVYMVGAFIGFFVMTWLGGPEAAIVPIWVMITLMFLAAMLGAGILGVLVERFAYRPLRDSPRIAPLISALGVSLFLQNCVLLLLGSRYRSYDTSKYIDTTGGLHLGPVSIDWMRLLVIVLAIALMLLLTKLVGHTRLGRGMRAIAYDREAAVMMGIDVDRVVVGTFFVASALAGAAGVMVGLVFFNVYSYMGFLAGLKGFSAAVIGGIGSIPGAMLGGILIGVLESFTAVYLSANFASVLTFLLLITVMLLKPRGLLGRAAIVKV